MRKTITLAISALTTLSMWAVTVESQPGQLASLVTDHSITSLKVTGAMDARDFMFIADNLNALSEIDLSEATIEAYSDEETALLGGENNFAAASIPCTSFFGKPLTSVALPASLKSIGFAAFAGCEGLTAITLPASLDSISSYAFSSTGITTISLPATVKVVGEGAFSRCGNLTSATVASATIGKDAFYADAALSALTLSGDVKAIGEGAFKSCSALTAVNFEGTNVATIGAEAFAYTSLSSLDLSSQASLATVDGWVLAKTQVSNVKLPSSVTALGEGAFFYASQLETANLPENLTTVPAFAFAGAETLTTDSIIPAGAESMGDYSFYNACGMQRFVIPEGVSYIGTKAMAGMTGLKTIKAYTQNAVPELGEDVWAGVDQPNVALDLDNMDLVPDFEQAAQWKEFHILKNYLMGDVNNDGCVDVSDVTTLISYVLGDDPNPFNIEVADIDGNGTIDVTDVTMLINMVLNGEEIIIRRAPRTSSDITTTDNLSVPAFSVRPGETKEVEVALNNTDSYVAMQFDVVLPMGLTLIEETSNTERSSSHAFATLNREDGKSRVVGYSMSNNTFNGNDGAVLRLKVKADEQLAADAQMLIKNVIFVNTELKRVIAQGTTAMVGNATGIDDANICQVRVFTEGNSLFIDSESAGIAQLVAMNGMATDLVVEAGRNTYSSVEPGIYVVRIAGKSFKVQIKN